MITGHPRGTNRIINFAKFKMNGTEIKKEHNVESLGLVTDKKLNWNNHFKLLKRKVAAAWSSLKQLKNILHQSRLCPVYRALVESHIRYADVVWGTYLRLNSILYRVSRTKPETKLKPMVV